MCSPATRPWWSTRPMRCPTCSWVPPPRPWPPAGCAPSNGSPAGGAAPPRAATCSTPPSGAEAAAPTAKKGGRSKKSDDSFGGPERTLAGLLTEQLAAGALAQAGKPPRWVTMGFAALLASPIERGSPYYRRLRAEAFEQWNQDMIDNGNVPDGFDWKEHADFSCLTEAQENLGLDVEPGNLD